MAVVAHGSLLPELAPALIAQVRVLVLSPGTSTRSLSLQVHARLQNRNVDGAGRFSHFAPGFQCRTLKPQPPAEVEYGENCRKPNPQSKAMLVQRHGRSCLLILALVNLDPVHQVIANALLLSWGCPRPCEEYTAWIPMHHANRLPKRRYWCS